MNPMNLEMCVADTVAAIETYMNEHMFKTAVGVAKVSFDEQKHRFNIELVSPPDDEAAA